MRGRSRCLQAAHAEARHSCVSLAPLQHCSSAVLLPRADPCCHLMPTRVAASCCPVAQEKLSGAQSDYVKALAALKSTANELENLFGRIQSSEKQAGGECGGPFGWRHGVDVFTGGRP